MNLSLFFREASFDPCKTVKLSCIFFGNIGDLRLFDSLFFVFFFFLLWPRGSLCSTILVVAELKDRHGATLSQEEASFDNRFAFQNRY